MLNTTQEFCSFTYIDLHHQWNSQTEDVVIQYSAHFVWRQNPLHTLKSLTERAQCAHSGTQSISSETKLNIERSPTAETSSGFFVTF